jgi:hypothetical protein
MRVTKPKKRRKLTVEECTVLDSHSFAKKALLAGFPVENIQINPTIEVGISYSVSVARGAQIRSMEIVLTGTRTSWGALRWWFLCPISTNGILCNRRVGKLYLPHGTNYFGCRHCHNLTYKSVREHDKRVNYFRKNPRTLLTALEKPNVKFSTLLLALKALNRIESRY